MSVADANAGADTDGTAGVDAALLSAFEDASDRIVDKTLAQFADFQRRRRRQTAGLPATIDASADTAAPPPWRLLARARGVELFQERVETTAGGATTVVSAFGGGALAGSLDETLRGLYADECADARRNAAIQFGPHAAHGGVVRTFRRRSAARPYDFFGVKFVDRASAIPGVQDRLCWVERLGTRRSAESGQEVGFHLLKAADWAEDPDKDAEAHGLCVRPVRLSACYLYAPRGPDAVDVFVRGIVELPTRHTHRGRAAEAEAVRSAAFYLLAAVRGRECERLQTIEQLIDRSKTEREQLMVCHCSRVIKGLSKMDMCSGCREAMRRPKLVALKDADERKRGSTAPSESLEHLRLQSRLGSTRRDGEPPEEAAESQGEASSFRMFLPIHDERRERADRLAHDNVLLQMLRRRQRQRLRQQQVSAGSSGAATSARTAASSGF